MMELRNIEIILPIASGLLFIIQAVYYLGLYNKLYTYSRRQQTACLHTDLPPLSVIIVAGDAASELQTNLPAILEQDYPEFEVVVIHDRLSEECDDVLKLLKNSYAHLYHSFIPDSARCISHKKLGITMGIKASRYEWLVFTEPNCRPLTNQWLKQMAHHFTPETEIVLGYSNYESTSGWFNKKIIFDTLLHSMRFLGMALTGHPYTGTGRNLAYRKTLFYKQKGFASQLKLQRGEDDLFINKVARHSHTRVATSPESVICISAPKSAHSWREEKINYMMTSALYKGISRYVVGFETCSRFLFYGITMASLTLGVMKSQWILFGIALFLWTVRYAMQLMVFRNVSRSLKAPHFYSLLPIFDLLQPLWNCKFKLQQRMHRKDEFRRK